MDDMDQVLSLPSAADAVRLVLDEVSRPAAQRVSAQLTQATTCADVGWAAIDSDAGEIAAALEQRFSRSSGFAEAAWLLDTATMLRVVAGGRARRGPDFEWKTFGSGWTAVGPTATEWDVHPQRGGWGITVARWDYPDWWTADFGQAKRIAEEIDARPIWPRHLGVVEPLIGMD